MILLPMVELAQNILKKNLSPGDYALDATAGRGRDTAFLAELVGKDGLVYAFDIQKEALDSAAAYLDASGFLPRVKLILDSHENLGEYIKNPLAAGIFNLGYLPGGEKSLITQAKTTLKGIKQALNLIRPGGVLLIVAYLGHKGGAEEYAIIKELLKALPRGEYQAGEFKILNKNQAPVLFIIEKSLNKQPIGGI